MALLSNYMNVIKYKPCNDKILDTLTFFKADFSQVNVNCLKSHKSPSLHSEVSLLKHLKVIKIIWLILFYIITKWLYLIAHVESFMWRAFTHLGKRIKSNFHLSIFSPLPPPSLGFLQIRSPVLYIFLSAGENLDSKKRSCWWFQIVTSCFQLDPVNNLKGGEFRSSYNFNNGCVCGEEGGWVCCSSPGWGAWSWWWRCIAKK